LRVNGRAVITIDRDVLASLSANGKPACAAIRVAIEKVYFQCGKALVRSDLWNPDKRVPRAAFAPFGQILAEQVKISYDPGIETALAEDYRTGLY
jgi:predicted pyridoxine 5'-phosphate oxidase superfamily flavin-nucleotide-binding protein